MHDTMPLLKITIPYSVLSLGYYWRGVQSSTPPFIF
jgi:hypothetical protein